MTEKEYTLFEALTYATVEELPPTLANSSPDWVKAIALVLKHNGRENYAIAENVGEEIPAIVKDFGDSCAIRKIIEIYPYAYLEGAFVPKLSSKEDIVSFLTSKGEDEKKITQLISKTTKTGEEKTESQRKKDKAKIKALVNKYALVDVEALRAQAVNK